MNFSMEYDSTRIPGKCGLSQKEGAEQHLMPDLSHTQKRDMEMPP